MVLLPTSRVQLVSMDYPPVGCMRALSSRWKVSLLPTANDFLEQSQLTRSKPTGMSESLAKEVSSWGIRVLIVEPGVFRTNFFAAYVQSNKGLSEPYKGGVVDETLQKFDTLNGRQPGDPVKGAKAIVDVVASSGADGCTVDERKVLRLP